MSTRISDREPVPPRKRGRGVPLVFGVTSLVLVAVALTFALSSPPPSTPPLAEVAPAPQERIEVERVEQSSRFGEGAGEGECVAGDPGCQGASAQASREDPGTATQPEAGAGSPVDYWDCVPGPGGPRQTQDPQSPPCAGERFEGDNGGATATGVTPTTVRIAVATDPGDEQEYAGDYLEPMVTHVNRRYEQFGRRLELVYVELNGDDDTPEGQRARAQQVIEVEPFAAVGTFDAGAFARRLAEGGVISVVGGGEVERTVPEAALAPHDPYLWTVYASSEEAQDATGALVCSALAGRPATHGGTAVAERERVFGIVNERGDTLGDPPTILRSRLDACGASYDVYEHERGGDTGILYRRMRDDGVTTVLCHCSTLYSYHYEAADEIGYEPEWLLPGIPSDQVNNGYRAFESQPPANQLAHTFGLTPLLRRPALNEARGQHQHEEQYWYHAARDGDPGFSPPIVASQIGYGWYAQLLILASGIQGAGPDLTPASFGETLSTTDYPNPGVGKPRWYQPAVGFGPADHAFNSDFALIWWDDPTAGRDTSTGRGRLCYVGDGARFTASSMPADADERLFDPEAGCR